MRKRIMIIGPTGSGKTTLCHALNEFDGPLRKTQDMIYGKYTIDVPGSYLDNPWMYKYLISAAQNAASRIVCLVDSTATREVYSPGFARVFTVPVTGVITKCGPEDANAHWCEEQLKRIGVDQPWFYLRNQDDKAGLESLKEVLFSQTLIGGENEIYH